MAACTARAVPRILPVLPAAGLATSVGLPVLPSRHWQGTRDHVPAQQYASTAQLLPKASPPPSCPMLSSPLRSLFLFVK